MNEQTETMWVILMTPRKNILAKISSLKMYGKIKIEELKILYGKKGIGGWVFQILGQPKSRTFSFHDGEVVRNTKAGYVPFRKYGCQTYFLLAGLIFVFLMGSTLFPSLGSKTQSVDIVVASADVPKIVSPKPTTSVNSFSVAKIQKQDPATHDIFLKAKLEFQSGHIDSCLKTLRKNTAGFSDEDKKETQMMLAEIFYLKCENFSAQHETRKAVIHCEKAVASAPHIRAQIFLNNREVEAKKLYLEGYTLQKLTPVAAKQKYTQVLQVAKTKSSWRGKAQYQLRKLK